MIQGPGQRLTGNTFYLRGGYLDNSLPPNENGRLTSNSPQASYPPSLIEINKVHLGKHKLVLEGVRYGRHFLGCLPSTDPTQAADMVRLTPNSESPKIEGDQHATPSLPGPYSVNKP